MSSQDPSTWLSYGAVLVVWVALLPWWWDDGLRASALIQLLATAVVAALLLVLNWVIGGMWAVAISGLGDWRRKLPYFVEVGDISAAGDVKLSFGLLSGALLVLAVLVSVVVFGHSYLGI